MNLSSRYLRVKGRASPPEAEKVALPVIVTSAVGGSIINAPTGNICIVASMLIRLTHLTPPGFQQLFPNERMCSDYMVSVRWRKDLSAGRWRESPAAATSPRTRVFRSQTCKGEIPVTAETAMDRSHTPLSVWF